MKENILAEKAFHFSLQIINLVKNLKLKNEYIFADQILRSGTSIGANIEEASAAESRADFKHKLAIASKEARETRYWLRLLEEAKTLPYENIENILGNVEEIIRILSATIKTLSK